MTSMHELGLAAIAGSLTTLNPCVFPMLPLVLGGGPQAHRLAPLAMGAGMVASFAGLGLLVGMAGDALGLEPEHVRRAGAVLLVVFGLMMWAPAATGRLSGWATPLATRAHQTMSSLKTDSLSGAFGVGSLLGMVWSPCSGPLLASALALVATEGGALRGGLILATFGLGAATVLVAVAYASRPAFSRVKAWVTTRIETVKAGFGSLMVLLGITILLGWDKWLEARLLRWLPDAFTELATSI
jgi:cytochrome c biogenesis protein CcdA